MKATELLKKQHQQVDTLFEQIESSEGPETRSLVEELASTLVAHSTIEKEIFYPACEEELGATGIVRQAYEEHALVEYALQKLLTTDPGDESFHARCSVLKELVQRHVQEEETELIPLADREMDEVHLADLGERMESRFEEVQAEDVESILAGEVQKAAPRTTRRRAAKAPARKVASKAASKPAGGKRAPAARTKATAATRGASKTGRAAAPARKKAAPQARAEGGRGGTSGGQKARGAKGGRNATGGRKGRSSTAR